ncbi:MAG: M48 family metallopeptidase [Parcubacteria group bacterium]|nr:M48 family metallopeptidase [Parcubacteria group bacterium]
MSYILKKSWRAKKLRISISKKNGVVVTVPWFCSKRTAEQFLNKKSSWVSKHLNKITNAKKIKPAFHIPRRDKRTYQKHKEEVREFIKNTLEKYNKFYKYSYNRIFIKNQKTRWGSCSEDRNLNFNYRIRYLPLRIAEYIVVHELCHLHELNHSKRFWVLVEKTFEDYREIEKQLRKAEM